jgi:hypothetical protein
MNKLIYKSLIWFDRPALLRSLKKKAVITYAIWRKTRI